MRLWRCRYPQVSDREIEIENLKQHCLGTVGHGVSMTQLNGRTVADLILEKKTDLTDVFFVNRRTIPWPPQPLRSLAIKAIRGYMQWEDSRFDPRPGT